MIYKQILYRRTFIKSYRRITSNRPKLKDKIREKVILFLQNKHSRLLNDHELKGNLLGQRSFSVQNDLRIIYEDLSDCYLFVDIGTHNQVYK
jgi:addiction module RelE/StbE family toxin